MTPQARTTWKAAVAATGTACLAAFGACEPPQAILPGAVPIEIVLLSAIHDFPTEQFGDSTNPGVDPAMLPEFQNQCDTMKANNVVFTVRNLDTGSQENVPKVDIVAEAVPAPRVLCKFTAGILRNSDTYKFTALVSATPTNPDGWTATCTRGVTHPDLANSPDSPVWEDQHWVHFTHDSFVSPTFATDCCAAQQNQDIQPDPPGFPPNC